MYPLNMHNPDAGGYAVASDSEEHKRLSDAGYLPPLDQDQVAEPEKRKPGRPKKVQE